MQVIDILGLVGTSLFAISGVPTAWQSWSLKETKHIPVTTQWAVFIGASSMLTYLLAKFGFDWIVLGDYVVTILSWAVILWFHYFPKKQATSHILGNLPDIAYERLRHDIILHLDNIPCKGSE